MGWVDVECTSINYRIVGVVGESLGRRGGRGRDNQSITPHKVSDLCALVKFKLRRTLNTNCAYARARMRVLYHFPLEPKVVILHLFLYIK